MKRFTYLFLVLIALFVISANNKKKGIRHDENKALTWEDFKGRADKKSEYAANTTSGFTYNASMVGDSMKVVLPTTFSPKESWVKKKKKSDHLLKHEQLHFDITELYVRKMRKEILSQKFTLKKYERNVSKILKKYSKESSAFQNKYDRETKHSINVAEQDRWNSLVEKSLKTLDAYKVPVFMVGIEK